MATEAAILARVRTAIDDVAGDKSAFRENLARSPGGTQINGTNQDFQLLNRRVIAGSVVITADGSAATVSTTTAGLLRGRVSITSTAPSTSCLATYDYQYFTDEELTTILEGDAASFIDFSDLTQVPNGLLNALVFFAGSVACRALAVRMATLYNAGAGGRSAQKGDIGKKYNDLADRLAKQATDERLLFYGSRKGEASSPAYGKFTPTQKVWTPRR